MRILECREVSDLLKIFSLANKTREKLFGKRIETCSIINAKSGNCPEDCAFCAQSKKSSGKISEYPLVSDKVIISAAKKALDGGSARFSIVTSGRKSSKKELTQICKTVEKLAKISGLKICASLGILDEGELVSLKNAGLDRYHHNLECAGSLYPSICSTKNYSCKLETCQAAKSSGLSLCSGAIFGMGESNRQIVELFGTLKKINPDSVPMNFLNPIPGSRLEKSSPLPPFECLKIISAARLYFPNSSIRVCGGREFALKDYQSWIFAAGADSFMSGGYLVTPGRSMSLDKEMIHDFDLFNL